MKRRFSFAVVLAATVLLLPPATQEARAQALTGSIVGNVTDSSGASIPDAAVTITETGTQQVRAGTTNATGSFDFDAVQPGQYDIKVSKTGFITTTRTQVALEAAAVVRVDIALAVGNVSDSVTISATAAALQTDTAQVQSDLGTTQIESVPLSNNRNFQGLLATVPGFTLPHNTHSVNTNPSGSYQFSVGGGNSYENNVRIDGALATQSFEDDSLVLVPTLESIEAVNAATNSFDAETGTTSGGAVSVTTKSGTNELHGSLFDLFTSNHLKSRPFFLPKNQPMGRLTLNRYGGSVGGAIIKNKLFYFVSYEGVFDAEDASNTFTIADALEKSGNFSESTTPIYDPATGAASGAGRTAFPGNIIPVSRIDPIAQAIENLMPVPNVPGNPATKNYGVTAPYWLRKEQADTKLNYNPTSKLSIFQKLSLLDFYQNAPPAFGYNMGGSVIDTAAGNPGTGFGQTYVLTSSATYILTPRLILDGYFAWETDNVSVEPYDVGVNRGLALGIPGTNGPYRYQSGLPQFNVTSYDLFGENGSSTYPYYRDNGIHQYAVNLGWNKGAHDLRFGFEYVQRHLENLQITGAQGVFTFGTGPTQVQGGPSGNQYNSYATFLLGLPTSVVKGAVLAVPPSLYSYENMFSGYVRDRWAISRKFTASLGVRWDYFGFPYVPFLNNNGPGLYDIASNTVQICGYGQVPKACGVSLPKALFSPRLGLAYRLTDTFVIRAGYGITQVPLAMANGINGIYPANNTTTAPAPNSLSWAGTLEQGAPAVVLPTLGNGTIVAPGNVTMTVFPRTWVWPYVQSWNLTLQKQFGHGFSAQTAYVANNTIHLMQNGGTSFSGVTDLNAGQVIGQGTAGQPFFASEGRTSSVNLVAPKGTEKYYSLQSSLTRRFSDGFLIGANWTWSKTMTTNYFTDALLYQYVNKSALQAIDRTHVVSLNTVYELPFGKGKRWFSDHHPVAAALLGGWQISSVAMFASGLPFTISSSATSLNLPGATQSANQVLPNVAITGNVGGAWFNPLAFKPVTTANFGNVGFDSMRGPGVANVDFSLSRTFPLTERFKLQLRADAANISNTPHFSNPGGNVSNLVLNPDGSVKSLGGFAQITSVVDINGRSGVDERQVTFMLRLSF